MKIINLLLILLINSIIFTNSFAGDVQPRGFVLTEESYVFKIDEAKKIMSQLSFMESELKKQKELLEQYNSLDNVQEQEVLNATELIRLKELQIEDYKKLYNLNLDRVVKLEKQINLSKYEKWIFMGLGIGVTIGSILIADKLDDSVETQNANGAALFRF